MTETAVASAVLFGPSSVRRLKAEICAILLTVAQGILATRRQNSSERCGCDGS